MSMFTILMMLLTVSLAQGLNNILTQGFDPIDWTILLSPISIGKLDQSISCIFLQTLWRNISGSANLDNMAD